MRQVSLACLLVTKWTCKHIIWCQKPLEVSCVWLDFLPQQMVQNKTRFSSWGEPCHVSYEVSHPLLLTSLLLKVRLLSVSLTNNRVHKCWQKKEREKNFKLYSAIRQLKQYKQQDVRQYRGLKLCYTWNESNL